MQSNNIYDILDTDKVLGKLIFNDAELCLHCWSLISLNNLNLSQPQVVDTKHKLWVDNRMTTRACSNRETLQEWVPKVFSYKTYFLFTSIFNEFYDPFLFQEIKWNYVCIIERDLMHFYCLHNNWSLRLWTPCIIVDACELNI